MSRFPRCGGACRGSPLSRYNKESIYRRHRLRACCPFFPCRFSRV
nr:MAG TPA: hypothetical protein [Caudoviricetes sp.]